jgi:hypothetical protein
MSSQTSDSSGCSTGRYSSWKRANTWAAAAFNRTMLPTVSVNSGFNFAVLLGAAGLAARPLKLRQLMDSLHSASARYMPAIIHPTTLPAACFKASVSITPTTSFIRQPKSSNLVICSPGRNPGLRSYVSSCRSSFAAPAYYPENSVFVVRCPTGHASRSFQKATQKSRGRHGQ